jgi:hypothetical protein
LPPRTRLRRRGWRDDRIPDPRSNSFYLLAHLTSNPLQAARYHALGLPTQFQPNATSTDTAIDATSDAIEWTFAGANLDHTIHAATEEPPLEPMTTQPGIRLYFDGPHGDLRLSYENTIRPPSTATISADFTAASLLTPLLALPRLQTISGVSFAFQRGGWTSTLERAG